MPVDIFKAKMDAFVQDVRAQPRQPDVERIFVPGEIEHEREAENRRLGIVLTEAGRSELSALAEHVDVAPLAEFLTK